MALRGDARSGGAMSHSSGATSSVRRIQRELKEICESPSRHWTASPVADDLFEWQFALRGPPGTDFEGGIYTGRVVLPVNYPMAPPSIMLLTPNGRWEVGKKICLSNSSYHPELWQPAWGIRTMMEALRSHFPTPGDGAIGALDWPAELRRKLAKESLDFVCPPNKCPNRQLLPELSPEELREDQPEHTTVPPELAPAAEATPAPEAPSEPGQMGDAPQPDVAEQGGKAPEVVGTAQAYQAAAPAAAATSAVPSVDPSVTAALSSIEAKMNTISQLSSATPAAQATPAAPASAAAASSAAAAAASPAEAAAPAPSRRRQLGSRQQRRPQQPLIVQLLKPPRSGRGWVICAADLLVLMLTITFFLVLGDMVQNPPQLLNPLPEPPKDTQN